MYNLQSKEEIKKVKDFVKQVKELSIDYSKINELIKNNIEGDCEFITWRDEQVCCCDVDSKDTYNLIKYILLLGKRYYTGINTGDVEYSYITNTGNTNTITIDVILHDVTTIFKNKINKKYKTIIAYRYHCANKSLKDGWDGDTTVDTDLDVTFKGKPVKFYCKKMKYYVASGQGNNFSREGYIHRSKYHIEFDNARIYDIWEYGNDAEYLWVTMEGDSLPYASYYIKKLDILNACKQTNIVAKELNKLKSKLVKNDFIVNLNDNIKNLKIKSEYITNENGESVEELTFYTTDSIPEVAVGLKFITIKMEKDDEYMYRFNGCIGKESLSYNRPIETDEDIKQAIDATLGMISYSPILNKYKNDLLEIKNNL